MHIFIVLFVPCIRISKNVYIEENSLWFFSWHLNKCDYWFRRFHFYFELLHVQCAYIQIENPLKYIHCACVQTIANFSIVKIDSHLISVLDVVKIEFCCRGRFLCCRLNEKWCHFYLQKRTKQQNNIVTHENTHNSINWNSVRCLSASVWIFFSSNS